MKLCVFVYGENEEVKQLMVFRDAHKALKTVIPLVAERVGYTLTGDDSVDWDRINTEVDHPGQFWHLEYAVQAA